MLPQNYAVFRNDMFLMEMVSVELTPFSDIRMKTEEGVRYAREIK